MLHLALCACLLSTAAADDVRQELSLAGTWEYQLVAELGTPPTTGVWKSCPVPGYLSGTHDQRAWLRRSFAVPASMRGQRIKLHFGGVKYHSRIYLNGRHVGGCFGGYEPFEIDVTEAVRWDGLNELAVGCHDWTGVFTPGQVVFPDHADGDAVRNAPRDKILSPIGGLFGSYGIWDDVALCAHPPVYVQDLFIQPSVRRRELVVNYTVANVSASEVEVELGAAVQDQSQDVLTLSPTKLKVPAGKTTTVTLRQPWPKPPLWSHLDPHLLQLRTTLSSGDRLRTRFGFREFWVAGHKFFLNGTQINLLATSWWPPSGTMTRDEIRQRWEAIRQNGCVAFRTHTQPWPSLHYEVADEVGLLMIVEGAVWNDDDTYRIHDPVFWENYGRHLQAMVDRDKNRPSVIMWSLENEFFGGRLNDASPAKQDLVRMGQLVKAQDPTRPIVFESDGDPDGVADVIGIHYPHEYPDFTCWPNEALWLQHPAKIPHMFLNGASEFVWRKDKPIYVGEFLWTPSRDPSWHTVFFGDEAYIDYQRYRNLAKAESWKMQILGYRHLEVGGISPWTVIEGGPLDETNPLFQAQQYAYQPLAAYPLDYDRRFYSGETVVRRVDLFHEDPDRSPLELSWTLTKGDEVLDRGRLQPGSLDVRQSFSVRLPMPQVERRTEIAWQLTIRRHGQSVFQDTHRLAVFPKLQFPAVKAVLGLWDPSGTTQRVFAAAGLRATAVAKLTQLPADLEVLVIGAGALQAAPQGVPVIGRVAPERAALDEFLNRGGRLLVLRQDAYPEGLFDVTLTQHRSTMTFPQRPEHPALRDVAADDLKFWRGDHVVATEELARPSTGGVVPIVVSGSAAGVDHAPLLERRVGRGRRVHAQLALVEKFDTEPTAARILVNLVEYLTTGESVAVGFSQSSPHTPRAEIGTRSVPSTIHPTLIHSPVLTQAGGSQRGPDFQSGQDGLKNRPTPDSRKTGVVGATEAYRQYLRSLGLQFDDLTGKLETVDWSAYGLVLCRGEVPSLEKLKPWVESGGRLWLHRSPAASLERVCRDWKLDLVAQPYAGPVTRAEGDHPLLAALAREDLYWLGKHVGIDWADTPRATAMADLILGKTLGDKQASTYEVEDWKLEGQIIQRQSPGVTFATVGSATQEIAFPTAGDHLIGVLARGTPCFGVYPIVQVAIDGRPFGQISVTDRWQTTCVLGRVSAGRHQVSVSFINDAGDPPRADRNLYVDKVSIARDDNASGVQFLASPAALAVVQRGQGLVGLDQMRWDTEEPNSRKAARLASAILTELGGVFAPRRGVTIRCDRMAPQPDMPFFSNQGGSASLACNGYVKTSIQVAAAGRTRVEIVAAGTPAQGIYPLVEVVLNGNRVGQIQLTAGHWRSYYLDLDLAAGEHEFRLAFVNDATINGQDRNLLLDKVTFFAQGE